jgi:hypothetical protein
MKELYVVVASADLPRVAAELDRVLAANARLADYHAARRQALTSREPERRKADTQTGHRLGRPLRAATRAKALYPAAAIVGGSPAAADSHFEFETSPVRPPAGAAAVRPHDSNCEAQQCQQRQSYHQKSARQIVLPLGTHNAAIFKSTNEQEEHVFRNVLTQCRISCQFSVISCQLTAMGKREQRGSTK